NARTYLATLPEVRVSGDLTAVHGSPRDPVWEYIASPAVAAANLGSFQTWLCLFGHTHIPAIFRASDGRVEAIAAGPGDPVRLDARRALINPGSVGQPRSDRKSTRLNSSHVAISYAVFCLKKKKTIVQLRTRTNVALHM